MLLDLFSIKEVVEGFLFISKRSNAKLIILDLPSSHKYWKERYFFVSGCHWEYNSFDREDTLGVSAVWNTPENLREFPFALVWSGFQRLQDISNFTLVVWPSSIRFGLSPKEVKRKLVKCIPHAYFELIRSDIPGFSGPTSSRPPALRPSPPPVTKSRHEGPPVVKPTREELRARVEEFLRRR